MSDALAPSPAMHWPLEIRSAAPTERRIAAPEVGAQVLLAIDTALGTSVALGVGDAVFEASSDEPRGHTEAIGGLISRVFELAEVTPRAV
ncbi:MAG: hypothetical protein J0H64_09495, partial [Actinobacteria bacterium]|nr:hypothetical protein [Actinomycetota bacterium]